MKALTLTQPWASLVASGAKRVETRSWRTSYRGPLAIHAAKGFPPDARALCRTEPFATSLRLQGLGGLALLSPQDALPLGVVVALTWLEDCIPVEDCPRDEIEDAFGNFAPGRWAWRLREPVTIPHVPRRGSLGLWELPDELVPEGYRLAIRHPGL